MINAKGRGRIGRTTTEQERARGGNADGSDISFKPDLINKYQQDHKAILGIFNDALSAVQSADSKAFLDKLHDLQIALRKHLLDEELNLYIYLRHSHKQDQARQELINQFKRSSKKVGTETFAYISKVSKLAADIAYDDTFISELLEVGNLLEGLLEAEEAQLYPIYKRRAV